MQVRQATPTRDNSSESSKTYTATEISAALGLNINMVYQMAREGRIPCIRAGKRYIFPRAGFDKWLSTAGNQTAA